MAIAGRGLPKRSSLSRIQTTARVNVETVPIQKFGRIPVRNLTFKPTPLGRPMFVKKGGRIIPRILPTPVPFTGSGSVQNGKIVMRRGTSTGIVRRPLIKSRDRTTFAGRTDNFFPNRLKNVEIGTVLKDKNTLVVLAIVVGAFFLLQGFK